MKNVLSDDKIYFSPGQLVQLRQPLANKPVMVVHRVERSIMRKENGRDVLKGVKCRWFTDNGFLQEAIFSTKDLEIING